MKTNSLLCRLPHAVRRAPLLLGTSVLLTGCASFTAQPLTDAELQSQVQADRQQLAQDVAPLQATVTLEEAIARALKYNAVQRLRAMEEAMAHNTFEASKFDMLPKLVASAGYRDRNKDLITRSEDSVTGRPSLANPYISTDKESTLYSLGFSWSLLDFGQSYYAARQNADRALIAEERRRKALHNLVQDVRTAYWRVAAHQALQTQLRGASQAADAALADVRKVEAEQLRSPMEPLRYQRQLLENLRLLEAIEQELSSAQVELAALINAPIGQVIRIDDSQIELIDDSVFKLPLARLEEVALENNADLREQHYNSRLAREEVRKTMVRLFPNLSFSYGLKYDSDRYLVHNNWNEAGVQLSFNLFSLFTGPTQIKLAEAGVALADQRRVTTQMAVLTQVHLARLQLTNARSQFARAEAIYDTDQKIADQVRNRTLVQAQSKLDQVANDTTSILSLLRRYQALAQLHLAENRLLANLGLEPRIGSTGELSLAELTRQVKRNGKPWAALQQ